MRRTLSFFLVFAIVISASFFDATVCSAQGSEYTGAEVSGLYAGKYHSMLLTTNGELWVWGDNRYGQLGLGDTTNRTTPQLLLRDVIAAAAGGWSNYAITSDGTLWAWGNNEQGQLGLGDNVNRSSPVEVAGGAVQVAAALNYAYMLDKDGVLWAWGNSSYTYPDGSRLSSEPRAVAQEVDRVVCGGSTTLIFRGSSLSGWGGGVSGSISEDRELTETAIASRVSSAAASSTTVVYVDADGSLWQVKPSVKQKLQGSMSEVYASETHFLALDRSGGLWAWGTNLYGELGTGDVTDRSRPVQVLSGVKLAAAGSGFSLATKSGGGVWAWGDNTYGQIAGGDNRYSYNFPHVALSGSRELEQAAQGEYHIILNGELVKFDVQPINRNGRLIAPLRAVFEKYGSVSWNAATKTVTAVHGTATVELKIGSSVAKVNGIEVSLDTPAEIVSGRTMVPLRFLSETLGAVVTYDPSERTADIAATEQSIDLTAALREKLVASNVRLTVELEEGGTGTASGIVINSGGLILTNRHVVENAKSIKITASDGSSSKVWEIFYVDPDMDYAIVKTDLKLPAAAEIGRSGALRIGDKVVVCGNTDTGSSVVRTGTISSFGYAYGGSFVCSVQATQGLSGGGVYSASGLVGVVWGGVDGKTVAIPISSIVGKIESAVDHYGLK